MSGPSENATFFGAENEHVSGAHEVAGEGSGVAENFDGFGAVAGGDAGGGTFDGIDGFGHCGSETGGVGLGHHGDAKLFQSFFGDADERYATAFFDHEVHVGGGDMFSEHDEIAFIFSGGVIDDDDHFSGFEVLECFLDRGDHGYFYCTGFGDGVVRRVGLGLVRSGLLVFRLVSSIAALLGDVFTFP